MENIYFFVKKKLNKNYRTKKEKVKKMGTHICYENLDHLNRTITM